MKIPIKMFDFKDKGWSLVGKRIQVEVVEKPKKIGSIIVPDQEHDADIMQIGRVLAYGGDVFLYNDGTRMAGHEKFGVGCFVKFTKYAGSLDKKNDETLRTITSEEVEAIYSKEEYEALLKEEEANG